MNYKAKMCEFAYKKPSGTPTTKPTMLHLSLSARAECMDDIAVLMSDLLDAPAITRFLHGYSAQCSDYGEGMLELEFRCHDDKRKDMKTTIEQVIGHVQARADNDDLHVLAQTLNFTDEFDGARADDDLEDRILLRFTDKLRCSDAAVA